MVTLPIGLQYALESGECVLFVGAGIGEHLRDANDQCFPSSGSVLAAEIADQFSLGDFKQDLSKVAELLELKNKRTELELFLQKRLSNPEPGEYLRWIPTMRWRAIFTTNYDRGLERAYELTPQPPQKPKTISATSDMVEIDPRFGVPIYYLHGVVFGNDKPHIIITRQDYAQFAERRRMLFDVLRERFATSTFLYIGYSNTDPNWNSLFTETISELYPKKLPQAYRIAPTTDPLDDELLRAQGVNTMSCNYADFVAAAGSALSASRVEPDRMKRLQSLLPSDLQDAFERHPAAVARLALSWTYVNQAPFSDKPNIGDFLRGDRPNWSLIGNSSYFERDLEREVFEQDLLEYATAASPQTSSVAILGPAGYGLTTLLMALATKVALSGAGRVFMLKPGAHVLEGDVLFAASLFKERLFFFIDNAADESDKLRSVFPSFREQEQVAMFVLGERLNEWRQARVRLRPKEYELEALSDGEIERLLDCLAKHGELNRLASLERPLQCAVIRSKHGKQLLVAMREATEDNNFDAILIDEYHGIKDEVAQQVYLTVCCFHQHGGYVRDSVLAKLAGVSVQQLYGELGAGLEGVVIYECVDEAQALYAARARHRIIAEIVWERCGTVAERERVVHDSLASINLNYRVDKDAFDHFVRSDRVVDDIRTLDDKIRFFETACRKDPDNAYIRQHYARMLFRERRFELALSQIEEALRMDSSVKVLYHTKGTILARLAVEIESLEVARRRLVQSEDSFRKSLAIYDRDVYDYHGLAQLYFGWAKRSESAREASEYISKAEGVYWRGSKACSP